MKWSCYQMESVDSLPGLFTKLNRSLCRVLDKRTHVCSTMARIDLEARTMTVAICARTYAKQRNSPFPRCGAKLGGHLVW